MPKMMRWILTGLVIAAVGVVLMFVGLSNDGQNSLNWRDGHFVVPQVKTVNQQVKAFKSVNINTEDIDVRLVTNNDDTYAVKSSVRDAARLHISVRHNTLYVKYNTENDNGVGVGFGEKKPEHITISVPQNKPFDKFKQTSVGSDVVLKDLTAKTVKISATAGDITLNNLTAPDMTVANRDGSVHLTDAVLKQSTISMSDSDLTVQNGELGKLLLSGTDSDVHLNHTALNASVMQVNDGDVTTTASQYTGVNTFTLRDGDFKAAQAQFGGLQLQTTDGDVMVKGTKYAGQFSENETAPDRLSIIATDGDIHVN